MSNDELNITLQGHESIDEDYLPEGERIGFYKKSLFKSEEIRISSLIDQFNKEVQ